MQFHGFPLDSCKLLPTASPCRTNLFKPCCAIFHQYHILKSSQCYNRTPAKSHLRLTKRYAGSHDDSTHPTATRSTPTLTRLPSASPQTMRSYPRIPLLKSFLYPHKHPSIRPTFTIPFTQSLQSTRMSSGARKRKSPTSEAAAKAPAKRRVQSTTTQTGVSNFFKPTSQKEPEKTTWRLVAKTLLVGKYSNKAAAEGSPAPADGKKRIAGFDLVSSSQARS